MIVILVAYEALLAALERPWLSRIEFTHYLGTFLMQLCVAIGVIVVAGLTHRPENRGTRQITLRGLVLALASGLITLVFLRYVLLGFIARK